MKNRLPKRLAGFGIIVLLGSLLIGCAPESELADSESEQSAAAANPSAEEPDAGENSTFLPGIAQQGAVAAQVEMSEPGQVRVDVTPDSAGVSTDGTTTNKGATSRSNIVIGTDPIKPGGAPGGAPAGNSGGERPAPKKLKPVEWTVYDDPTHGFSIAYPSVYVIVPSTISESLQPQPITEVLFQAEDIANSDVAAFAPPVFTVRIYDNSAELSGPEWLTTHQLASAESVQKLETLTVGDAEGVRNCMPQAVAPNCFIYVPHGAYLYQLIPNGSYSDAMLDSFHFGG